MRSLLNSSKGSLEDYPTGILFIFLFLISSIFGYLLLSSFVTEFNATSVATAETTLLGTQFLNSIAVLDYVAVLILIVLIISIGISSFKVNASPVFFIISIIIAPFLGLMSYIMSYVFSQFVSQSVFSTVIVMFPRSILIGRNLHWVMLAFFIVGNITLYAKRRSTANEEQLL